MYSNSTTHYNLPQYEANDVPSILGDLNGAYNTIDSAIYAAADEASEATATAALAKTTADTALANVAGAQADATQALADAATADGKAVAAQTDATQALGDASDAMTAATNAQTDATNALTAATNAQTTASSALSAASDATTAAGNAATAASAAQTTANSAVSAANAAQSDATQALTNAATADGKAVAAGTKADSAIVTICDKNEAGDTATEAHNLNDIFYNKDGNLVQTTVAIAIGDTITTGTNVKAITLGEAVSYILDNMGGAIIEIHVEAASQTWGTQLDAIFGYYSNLTKDQKRRSFILRTNDLDDTAQVYQPVSITDTAGEYCRFASSSSGILLSYLTTRTTSSAIEKTIPTAGGALTVTTETEHTNSLKLGLYVK